MSARNNRRAAPTSDKAPSGSDELLNNASLALEATIALAPLIPIPVLSSLFSSVQVIVNAAKKLREDHRGAVEVAEQAAEMTKMIHETIHGKEEKVDSDLKSALDDFERKLEDIKNVMLEQVSVGFLRRLTRRTQFSERLATHRARLEYSMRTFLALSQARLEMKIEELRTEVRQLKKRHDDGYRIVHLGDLDFIEHQISAPKNRHRRLHNLTFPSARLEDETQVFSARRKGEVKLVKLYRNEKTFRGELEFLKLTRSTPKLSFAQIEGYSSSSRGSLIVITGASTMNFLANHLQDLDPIKRFAAILRVSCSWASASEFLRRSALIWDPDFSKMQVNAVGELVIGVHDKVGRTAHKGHNPGSTYVGLGVDVGRPGRNMANGIRDGDNLYMARDVESPRFLLNLLDGHTDDSMSMTFDTALAFLQQLRYSIFLSEGVMEPLTSHRPYRVGQLRDVDAFRDGHILEVSAPVERTKQVAHDKQYTSLDLFVPFEQEPKKTVKCHIVDALDLDWEDQCSRPIPLVEGAHALELCISERVDPCDETFARFLCHYGPYLAELCATELHNLCFVSGVSEIHLAQLYWKDDNGDPIDGKGDSDDNGEDPGDVACDMCIHGARDEHADALRTKYFHVRALGPDSSVKAPWGLFSDELLPIPEADLDKAGIVELDPSTDAEDAWWFTNQRHCYSIASPGHHSNYMEPYYQAARGVDVIYKQYLSVTSYRLPASAAAAIKWIHKRFPDEASVYEKRFEECYSGTLRLRSDSKI